MCSSDKVIQISYYEFPFFFKKRKKKKERMQKQDPPVIGLLIYKNY